MSMIDMFEIDWVAPTAVATAHITCRVCERPATVPVDHPALLCDLCLEDLDKTQAHVADWLGATLKRLDQNKERWEQNLAASDAASRWPAIQGALIAVAEKRATQSQLDATWAKRKTEGGALAQLLAQYEVFAAECDQIALDLDRLHRAQSELNTAYFARNV